MIITVHIEKYEGSGITVVEIDGEDVAVLRAQDSVEIDVGRPAISVTINSPDEPEGGE